MALVRQFGLFTAPAGSVALRVGAGVDPRARFVYERGGRVWSVAAGDGPAQRVVSQESETGTRALWRGEGWTATEYRFRGGLSRYAERDELYVVAEGGGLLRLGTRTETFVAGDLIDLTDYTGVYTLEIGEVSTLLKIAKEET